MSGKDIRKFMNLMEGVLNENTETSQGQILELIHAIFREQNQPKLNIPVLRDKLSTLISLLPTLEIKGNQDYHNKLEVVKSTLASIIRQLNPKDKEKVEFRSPDMIKDLVKKMLRSIYNEIIANDSSFEELAQSNEEARDKITKLASLINDKTSEPVVKKATKLIYKQAQQIS
jgi:hypothetical protein